MFQPFSRPKSHRGLPIFPAVPRGLLDPFLDATRSALHFAVSEDKTYRLFMIVLDTVTGLERSREVRTRTMYVLTVPRLAQRPPRITSHGRPSSRHMVVCTHCLFCAAGKAKACSHGKTSYVGPYLQQLIISSFHAYKKIIDPSAGWPSLIIIIAPVQYTDSHPTSINNATVWIAVAPEPAQHHAVYPSKPSCTLPPIVVLAAEND